MQITQADLPPVRGHVDSWSAHSLVGWALQGHTPLVVEARLGGRLLCSTIADQPRPDLGALFPQERNSATCGFALNLPAETGLGSGVVEIAVSARHPDTADRQGAVFACVPFAGRDAVPGVLAAAGRQRAAGPFPRAVTNIVHALWPDIAAADLGQEAGQAVFTDKVATLFATPRLRSMEPVARYARYLRSIWSHCLFVSSYFPADNAAREVGAKDYSCRQTSPQEIMSIANQLFVLRSYGVEGDLAEFGCFKGCSSAMLSVACHMLGIGMHVFDSFAGLPPSGSLHYRAGDFAGSLDEVQANIATFGEPGVVTFHKGFFADTLKTMVAPELMCLWMDVDLEASAEDLLVVADRLDPRATLFSHECAEDMFQDGAIVAARGADNPIPPVLDRFEALGRPLTGRFMGGSTGAFWARQGGTPVLANRLLLRLAAAA